MMNDSEADHLARAAKIVQRDKLEVQAELTGSFGQDCQSKFVLLALIDMIHKGPNNKSRNMSQATLVAQLQQYNSCIHRRAGDGVTRWKPLINFWP